MSLLLIIAVLLFYETYETIFRFFQGLQCLNILHYLQFEAFQQTKNDYFLPVYHQLSTIHVWLLIIFKTISTLSSLKEPIVRPSRQLDIQDNFALVMSGENFSTVKWGDNFALVVSGENFTTVRWGDNFALVMSGEDFTTVRWGDHFVLVMPECKVAFLMWEWQFFFMSVDNCVWLVLSGNVRCVLCTIKNYINHVNYYRNNNHRDVIFNMNN